MFSLVERLIPDRALRWGSDDHDGTFLTTDEPLPIAHQYRAALYALDRDIARLRQEGAWERWKQSLTPARRTGSPGS